MRRNLLLLVLGMIFFLSTFFAPKASATTYLARKYGISCSVCHNGALGTPTLFGLSVQRRGRIPDEEPTKNFSEIFSLNAKFRIHDGSAANRNSTFESHALSIYAGGVLSKHFSTRVEFYLAENTGRTTSPVNGDLNRTKLAHAYLQYTSNDSKPYFTTVRVGQIFPDQLWAFWYMGPRPGETRPYIINNSSVSPNSYRPFMRNYGVEVAQGYKNWHVAVGLINGTGAAVTNSVDNNRAKDMYATADYLIGDSGSAVGVYGYRGRGLVVPSSGANWENSFFRLGAFGRYVRKKLTLTTAMTQGQEQILPKPGPLQTRNLGFLAQADYNLNSRITAFARYDCFDPNTAKSGDRLGGPVLGLTYGLFESGRVALEYHKQGKFDSKPKPWEARLEVAWMF